MTHEARISISGVTEVSFADDLDAVLPGLVDSGLPASDVCGPGSALSGTSLLELSNASLGAGESCSFGVTLQVCSSWNTCNVTFATLLPAKSYFRLVSGVNG